MTIPLEILEAAYARSTQNNPKQLATEATELKNLVDRAMNGLYTVAARVNPTFFAKQVTVSFSAPGWTRPVDAESVVRLEAAGNEVVIVPYDERTAEADLPAVYGFGQVYRPAGNANDPTSGDLEIFYSKQPTKPALVTDPLDSLWRDTFDDLLILEVSIYLAIKDNRQSEFQPLSNERDSVARRFIATLEQETIGVRSRFYHTRRENNPMTKPIESVLAGGQSKLDLG